MNTVRNEFSQLQFASVCMQALLDHFRFRTVLDIGSGSGDHSRIFRSYDKEVTAVDIGKSIYVGKSATGYSYIQGNYVELEIDSVFDCVWASHVLEHQLNVNAFLKKIKSNLKKGGVLAITVPPLKHEIVGGHVSVWNAGLLIYNLILAGFDCRDAHILEYGYNISVIVINKDVVLPELSMDNGDVDRLSGYFPAGFTEAFNGDIKQLNWNFS
ncbi:MAG: class I SAM-dependent methyltransferase [Thiotrichales bacterium]|nr:class I SAM-dependent methyltransferase [Thiotrichales bacterium]